MGEFGSVGGGRVERDFKRMEKRLGWRVRRVGRLVVLVERIRLWRGAWGGGKLVRRDRRNSCWNLQSSN